ncbi:MAG: hypothetical protein CMB80_29740 [Flammeovirgaceae bacterium]|nr:hypothetical protein [Flammeovirgaceae bacterium]MBE61608.1 hypothetical protein [Flammeovirgaceae bacterium]MBR10240.1 hypothetical protein [Rickettsiales bacterium]HCX22857.1 hypothetical protein [Cytophagales bacterium]|tara:strand:- start:38 stop:421 length:384 start_codon:yes stop_codon:yes gene_type:complete
MKKLIALITLGLIWSCDSEKCSKVSICTDSFESVDVQILDQNSNLVALDSTATHKSGTKIYSFNEIEEEMEFFEILNDSHRGLVKTSGSEVIFRAWKDGELVIEEPYIIGHDCCHIQYIDGARHLVL